MRTLILVLAALALATPVQAADPPAKPAPAPSPTEIVAAAPQADWTGIDPADLLVMDLAADAKGKPRRVVIQLLPRPFSQGWVGNVRKLAAAHWWDGLSIYRVQDNYVTQWGDPDGDDKANARALPTGLLEVPQTCYSISFDSDECTFADVISDPREAAMAAARDAAQAAIAAANELQRGQFVDPSIESTKTRTAKKGGINATHSRHGSNFMTAFRWQATMRARRFDSGPSTATAWSASAATCRPTPEPGPSFTP